MSKISKKKLNEYLALSNEVSIDLVEENKKSYKIMIIGDKVKMKNLNFQEIVLEFIKEQKEFNNKVDQRFDKVEQRLDKVDERLDKLESFHKDEL